MHDFQGAVQTAAIITAVVIAARRGPVWKFSSSQKIAAPDLDRVDPGLTGNRVHQPFEREHVLLPAVPAIEPGRKLVRQDTGSFDGAIFDSIRTGKGRKRTHNAGRLRRTQIGADILADAHPD